MFLSPSVDSFILISVFIISIKFFFLIWERFLSQKSYCSLSILWALTFHNHFNKPIRENGSLHSILLTSSTRNDGHETDAESMSTIIVIGRILDWRDRIPASSLDLTYVVGLIFEKMILCNEGRGTTSCAGEWNRYYSKMWFHSWLWWGLENQTTKGHLP